MPHDPKRSSPSRIILTPSESEGHLLYSGSWALRSNPADPAICVSPITVRARVSD